MMADNVHRKLHKPSDGSRKISAPVHRTTSETIRISGGGVGSLVESEKTQLALGQLGLNNPSNTTQPNNNQCRKKTSSFQITSVTVGSRMSNDAGEDSNDDLDESHGEDNSVEHSRIEHTDIETPSYSEDTFSKEDVFFNASNAALSTAPVIPTSSQYGLAIVPSESGNPNNSSNDSNINTLDIASVTDNNIINLLSSNVKQDTDISIRDGVHTHGRNERFKVVKIESTEPFKRGRWTCMDYLDHTSVNQSSAITTPKVSDPNEVCISYGVTDGGIVAIDTTKASANAPINDDKGISIDMNGHASHQDICHNSISVSNNSGTTGYTVPQHNQPPTGQLPPQYYQQCSQHPTQQQQQQQQQQQPTGQQGGPQQQQQGSTLPSNLQSAHQNNLGQPQSMPQGSISIITQTNNNNVTPQQNISHTKEDPYVQLAAQNQTLSSQNVCQSSSTASNIHVTQSASQQPTPTSSQPQQQTINQISDNIAGSIQPIGQQQGIQNIHKVPQQAPSASGPTSNSSASVGSSTGCPDGSQIAQVSTSGQQQSQGGAPPTGAVSTNGSSGNGTTSAGNPQVQIAQANCQSVPGGIGFQKADTEQDSVSGLADAALLECLAEVTQAADDPQTLEDNESMSGTSAVAIDNKIEQAMDLVKSHLMFAVREEVEVLKEKIAELMDRINQLEAENSILKAHATAETLAQLNQSTTKLPQNNSASGQ